MMATFPITGVPVATMMSAFVKKRMSELRITENKIRKESWAEVYLTIPAKVLTL